MNYTQNYSMKLPGYGDNADIADLNENTTTIDELIHDNRTMIAQAYSQLESYVVGDIVENEGKLYRCIGATSGNWDSTKWTRTTLGDEVEESGASALADLDDVSLTTPTEGQILTYDGDEWVNADAPDVDVTKTASGNPIEVSDSASAPLVKCVTEIQGSQDLHGQDKPWVGGAGKNIIPMTLSGIRARNVSGTWTGNDYVLNGITFTVLTDNAGNVTGIKANGTASNNTIISFPLFQMQNVLHYGTGGVDVTNAYIYGGYNDGSWHPIPSIGNEQKSFTPEANQNYDVGIYIKSGYNAQNIVFYPMIRLATEADSTFAPYSNICPITAYTEGEIEVSDGDGNVTTHATTFPSAIYRGSEDVVNGTVYSDRGIADLENFTWTYNSDVDMWVSNGVPANYKSGSALIAEQYPYEPQLYREADKTGITGNGSYNLWCRNFSSTDTPKGKIVYELATPTTSSVTPTNLPIKSLSGYSHIESSTGDLEVEYITKNYSPITEIVDSQISALQKMMELMLTANREEEMKATQNYTAGDLLIVSGKLYKASSNIANGSTLVINSNVTSTTIAAELAALA